MGKHTIRMSWMLCELWWTPEQQRTQHCCVNRATESHRPIPPDQAEGSLQSQEPDSPCFYLSHDKNLSTELWSAHLNSSLSHKSPKLSAVALAAGCQTQVCYSERSSYFISKAFAQWSTIQTGHVFPQVPPKQWLTWNKSYFLSPLHLPHSEAW